MAIQTLRLRRVFSLFFGFFRLFFILFFLAFLFFCCGTTPKQKARGGWPPTPMNGDLSDFGTKWRNWVMDNWVMATISYRFVAALWL